MNTRLDGKPLEPVEIVSHEEYLVRVWVSLRDIITPVTAWTWPG